MDDASDLSIKDYIRPKDMFPESKTSFKIIRNKHRLQQPRSRMVGVKNSTQPFIFFGEDDAYLSQRHVATLFDFINQGKADICCTTLISTTEIDLDETTSVIEALDKNDMIDLRFVIFVGGSKRPRNPIYLPLVHSISLMYKNVFNLITFDEHYKGNAFREETDFYLEAFSHGLKIAFIPGPPAFHYKGSFNKGGGQHSSKILTYLPWYEYYVAKNNFYFLRKHKKILVNLGRPTSPFWDTFQFILRRSLGYPGRIKRILMNRLN